MKPADDQNELHGPDDASPADAELRKLRPGELESLKGGATPVVVNDPPADDIAD